MLETSAIFLCYEQSFAHSQNGSDWSDSNLPTEVRNQQLRRLFSVLKKKISIASAIDHRKKRNMQKLHVTTRVTKHELHKLWTDESNKDFVILCQDGEVSAHRSILVSGSGYIKRIFSDITTDSYWTDYFECQDLKSKMLEILVEFIYLSKVTIKTSQLEEFLKFGKEFEIYGLTNLSDINVICVA
eukprot:14063.XXX_980742_981299_1 [CDS] Oithona nana genome sequencing.